VAPAYADVNDMFGDIVKVTPTSKVVGDLAILMVSWHTAGGCTTDSGKANSVSGFSTMLMRGDLGQPYGGFPPGLQRKVLKGAAPRTERPVVTAGRPGR
jgi:pyruvate carboxylase